MVEINLDEDQENFNKEEAIQEELKEAEEKEQQELTIKDILK
eukprot:CAMPEP_0202965294 /NCGR_PEP_ID=MMETSP1396-20130829/9319_1 /ASSEMBLY_ACC=CAM_ASM_000872 /TAXON_ID= /ORGANISM="Pseudokeronopsis sp., Strain Brazil" /LENGTH=41 /DNA_ID= /DNA_START= /DNA_END= /DNA_ORIENTATION=